MLIKLPQFQNTIVDVIAMLYHFFIDRISRPNNDRFS